MVLEHYSPFIRENDHVTQHFTDSLPCVHAYRRAKKGAFSNSARIASFLTSLSNLNVTIEHMPGKNLKMVDYISRHPPVCDTKKCQICSFANEQSDIGDAAASIKSVDIQDVQSGKLSMPFTQRKTWIKSQRQDKTHQMLTQLIESSQAPEKKKTKAEYTKLKLLHNLYKDGRMKILADGLITVKHTDQNGITTNAISVPSPLFPGLIHALHQKLNHPSKTQLAKLCARYFYAPGQLRIIEEVTEACQLCTAMKQIPKELFSESTGRIDGLGSQFSADVI